MPERSVMDAILTQGAVDEVQILEKLFPKAYDEKKMVSEISPELMFAETLLGTIQRTFRSKRLKTFDDELLSRMKSKDRKGELAMIEVLLAARRSQESPLD